MIRNLGNMSKAGILDPLSENARFVADRLTNVELLREAKIHPIAVLSALRTYASGHGLVGSGAWAVNQSIVTALDNAFVLAFGNVPVTNKRWFLGLDVSGSMGGGTITGLPGVNPREASAAMAMVPLRTEPYTFVGGFATGFTPLGLSARDSLHDAVSTIRNLPFGGTDCSLPMGYAKQNRIPVDVFVVYTDSDTYAGAVHPSQALKQYRDAMGIPAKLAVVGLTSTGFTLADPKDAGMMDYVGFDASAPAVMANFVNPSVSLKVGDSADIEEE
jgi:60 kDa SS-A/Ro ribonucleoprotein